ncbi:MAG: AlkA N-terminal domain-containing protein [Halioglobus sp.]
MHGLDSDVCRRARLSRDSRFDGVFFLAVRTTGIYCRPICPARMPAEKNVRYYASAALAAADGYRPCLRCRPESAPNSAAWQGTSTTVKRALRLIHEGALSSASVPELADRLGIGERYLRKLFQRELGVTPSAVAGNQRLLFASKLLAETSMPMTDVAHAAGFNSLRRFNSAVLAHFRRPPSALRRTRDRRASPTITLRLHYRPPYDWEGVAGFFARHAIDGLETASPREYRRALEHEGQAYWIAVRPLSGENALQLEALLPDCRLLLPSVNRVRRMFDLDANPAAVRAALSTDARLARLLQQYPGIRSPGFWSLFEASARAVAGQQVSTAAARGILARLASASGSAASPAFPTPTALQTLGDEHFTMPGRRRATLRALGRAWAQVADDTAGLDSRALAALPGVGPWTVAMADMRGAGDPDCLPDGDLGLRKAWRACAGDVALKAAADHWRPWRAYAANLLWRSLA